MAKRAAIDAPRPLDSKQKAKILGEMLGELRKGAGLAQYELALIIKKHQTWVSMIEAGRKTASYCDVQEWCVGTGHRFADLSRVYERRIREAKRES